MSEIQSGSSPTYRNPTPTVDILIELPEGIVLIERARPPHGWAIPGGFVDEGESVEQAAIREAKEETSLDVELVAMLGVYSDPRRDPRKHTVSTVYIARAKGQLQAGDDARNAMVLASDAPLPTLAFDHQLILEDYRHFKATGEKPSPALQLSRALAR